MEQRVQPLNFDMAPAMSLALAANFGSAERWHEQFAAMGGARLCFRPRDGTLANLPVAQIDAGAVPLHEGEIDWAALYERYQHAVTQASEPFGVDRADLPAAAIVDVRRSAVFEQDRQLIPGASWADPAAVSLWGQALPKDRDVVVYCVYGHEVGRATALRLRAQGVRARFLRGGIDGWKAAGLPLADKEPESPGSPPARG